ncbi:MAG TPA: haloacid dehalogenase-like hydrolase [Acidimicrobiia bacterium]|nr:haloacid dehalogenase-like hydrolase [Acidimicrobiia bacterium]
MTRILDRFGSDLAALRGDALADAIRAAEGRTILAEVVAGAPPLLHGTSNAELVCGFGADLVCLNLVDPSDADRVLMTGLEAVDPPPIGFQGLSRLLGRPVGLNLEPDVDAVPEPLRASASRARAAAEGDAAFVIVTANPGRGATGEDRAAAVSTVREAAPHLLCLAGKMHRAGAEEPLGPELVESLVAAGAHGVLVPLPGTAPGLSEETAAAMVQVVRSRGGLAIGTIGTSQEGSDETTLRSLALMAKRIGVDVHHIGDAGFTGIAHPENVYAYAVAVRGVRHTWNRMARNVRATWKEATT